MIIIGFDNLFKVNEKPADFSNKDICCCNICLLPSFEDPFNLL